MPDVQYQSIPLVEEYKPKGRQKSYLHLLCQEAESTRTLNRSHSHWAWLAHAVLLSVSITLFTLSYCLRSGSHTGSGHGPLVHPGPSAPVIDYETKKAGLDPGWRASPYVGQGTEVDNAWSALTEGRQQPPISPRPRSSLTSPTAGDIFITEDEAESLGLSPHSEKNQHPETGEWGYKAGVEVFHQLRCLDLLRQAAYRNTHYPMDVDADLGMWRWPQLGSGVSLLTCNSGYCVELLREALMCHSDAGIFTARDAPGQGGGGIMGERLEFNGSKMCRSFEALKRWSDAHSVM
jgi:hypothetical protein